MSLNQNQKTEFVNPKSITAKQILLLLSKSQLNKERLLKQLQQLDIDISQLDELSLNQIYLRVQPILKNTYSIKYLGLNQNEMGIISRRIDPTRQMEFFLKQQPQLTYTINKYFYPKPLRVGRKPQSEEEQKINLDNLETQIKKSFQVNKNKDKKSVKVNGNGKVNGKVNGNVNGNGSQKQNQLANSSSLKPNKKRTQVFGSWMSIGKIQNTIQNQKKQMLRQKLKPRDSNSSTKESNFTKKSTHITIVPQEIPMKRQTVNSFSKFLNKGVILVKDC